MSKAQNFTEKHRAAVARFAAETGMPDGEIAELAFREGLYGVDFPKKPSTSTVQVWRGRVVTAEDVINRGMRILDGILTIELPKLPAYKQISLISQAFGAVEKRPRKDRPVPKPKDTEAQGEEETAPSLERLREAMRTDDRTV